jgi:hypothetical protein
MYLFSRSRSTTSEPEESNAQTTRVRPPSILRRISTAIRSTAPSTLPTCSAPWPPMASVRSRWTGAGRTTEAILATPGALISGGGLALSISVGGGLTIIAEVVGPNEPETGAICALSMSMTAAASSLAKSEREVLTTSVRNSGAAACSWAAIPTRASPPNTIRWVATLTPQAGNCKSARSPSQRASLGNRSSSRRTRSFITVRNSKTSKALRPIWAASPGAGPSHSSRSHLVASQSIHHLKPEPASGQWNSG